MEKHLPNLLIGAWIAALCVAVILVSKMVSPSSDLGTSQTAHAGGTPPEGKPWIRFVASYHLVLVTATLFSLTLFLLFPVIIDFRQWAVEGQGVEMLLKVSLFLVTMICALFYAWKKGDLNWKTGVVQKIRGDHGDS